MRDKLLKRLFGFELLMAPYTIAHMKLAMLLRELGYDFPGNQRLGVYLTNTLEEAAQRSDVLFAQYIAEEANAASRIKRDEPIMVVIGNPPYSNFGRLNKGPWIMGLLEDYKRGLNEKKLNLDDDYIKFIRFAQWRIERTGHGIVGFITNNSYLDGITHRRMRESLLEAFDVVRICNLHGDSRKEERTPDGQPDKNVFDIQQGVAVVVLVRRRATERREVHYTDLFGDRESKYRRLSGDDMSTSAPLAPSAPRFFLARKDLSLSTEWDTLAPMPQAFGLSTTGVQTARDEFAVACDRTALVERLGLFVDGARPDEGVRLALRLKDSRGWRLADARKALSADGPASVSLEPYAYRPFDVRFVMYDKRLIDWPRADLMGHVAGRANQCLLASRGTLLTEGGICLCTRVLPDKRLLAGSTGEAKVFPLYIYPSAGTLEASEGRRPNLSPKFIAEMEAKLGLTFVPEGGTTVPVVNERPVHRRDAGATRGMSVPLMNDQPLHPPDAGATPRGMSVSLMNDQPPHPPDAGATPRGMSVPLMNDQPLRQRDAGAPNADISLVDDETRITGTGDIEVRHGANLPHWLRLGAIYAVTFRLHGSLPAGVVERWRIEAFERRRAEVREAIAPGREGLVGPLSEEAEDYLDEGRGECWMKQPEIADLVQSALLHFDGERYDLLSWCVMPNHVHVVLQPYPEHPLDEITHSWKSFTAHEANRLLGRTGPFWQKEPYDHLIRNAADLDHSLGYVAGNPAKAGLTDWRWCGAKVEYSGDMFRGTGVSPVNSLTRCGTGVSPVNAPPLLERDAHATEGTFSPEDVFDYIYAVLHSPTYRERYAEFLKIDFPRIPLTSDVELFRRLCMLGGELVALHLMEHPCLEAAPAKLEPAGSNEVEAVRYDENTQRVYINQHQHFSPIEPEVYAFQIGGYQVLNKWLKDRKGRTLTFEDVRHYGKVVLALRETRRLMQEIDAAVSAWPIE